MRAGSSLDKRKSTHHVTTKEGPLTLPYLREGHVNWHVGDVKRTALLSRVEELNLGPSTVLCPLKDLHLGYQSVGERRIHGCMFEGRRFGESISLFTLTEWSVAGQFFGALIPDRCSSDLVRSFQSIPEPGRVQGEGHQGFQQQKNGGCSRDSGKTHGAAVEERPVVVQNRSINIHLPALPPLLSDCEALVHAWRHAIRQHLIHRS